MIAKRLVWVTVACVLSASAAAIGLYVGAWWWHLPCEALLVVLFVVAPPVGGRAARWIRQASWDGLVVGICLVIVGMAPKLIGPVPGLAGVGNVLLIASVLGLWWTASPGRDADPHRDALIRECCEVAGALRVWPQVYRNPDAGVLFFRPDTRNLASATLVRLPADAGDDMLTQLDEHGQATLTPEAFQFTTLPRWPMIAWTQGVWTLRVQDNGSVRAVDDGRRISRRVARQIVRSGVLEVSDQELYTLVGQLRGAGRHDLRPPDALS